MKGGPPTQREHCHESTDTLHLRLLELMVRAAGSRSTTVRDGNETAMTWGHDARRKALASIAVFALLASVITVFSPTALGNGNPPHVECASTDPAWNDGYWKVQIDNGTLSTVETNFAGAISLDADGSLTNNNENPVFRIVLKVGGVGDDPVLSGIWETGEGGTIDLTLSGLAHVTFCFTDDVPDDAEPTTTLGSSTSTTSASSTTTTAAGPTTTTSPDAWTAPTTGESTTTPASDDTKTNAATNSIEISDSALAGDASEADASGEQAEESKTDSSEWPEPEGSLPVADRDTIDAVPPMIGWGRPPASGQAIISSNAVPDGIRRSDQFPSLQDLAILGALIAAIAVVIVSRRLDVRRLVGK
jgi:hypothetical protein